MRVWFNRHFSLVARVCLLLREARDDLPLTLLVSHRHEGFAGYATADEWFVEPAGLEPDAYVDWCLHTAVERRVEWLVPGHEASALAAAAPRFAVHGIRLLSAVADAALLAQLHRKEWVYDHAPASVPRPRWHLVTDDAQLETALHDIERSHCACIKPTVSIYGLGYHRLTSAAATAAALAAGVAADEHALSPSLWRQRHGALTPANPQLVMQHLPGHEYSVDLACHDGRVLAGVVRRKPLTGNAQLLDDRPDLLAHATALVEAFGLRGLINVQFKDDAQGHAHLLEINPRASGGIGMSCLSGLNLPAIAYTAAFDNGRLRASAAARHGLRVIEIPTAVALPEAMA